VLFNIPQTPEEWAYRVMGVIVLLLSLTVHEWAHAFSAKRLGDDTAEREGRLTLDPLVHLDPVGTLLFPLLGMPVGWAKPVPFNPARFRRGISMAWGTVITKAAGPVSNLVLGALAAVGVVLLYQGKLQHAAAFELARQVLLMNVGLAVFNLLPIHPLDGAGVVEAFVPTRLTDAWNGWLRIGPFVLMLLLLTGASFLQGPIRALSDALVNLAVRLLT